MKFHCRTLLSAMMKRLKVTAIDRNRELDCISLADFGSDIDALIDDPRTNCLSNDDCYDDVSKCRLFVNFLVCDQRSNFVGTYRALCDDI
mmetsp:Transcript_4211/g.6038  ORF Transcript_4211/g.6038 Transcript_4211/m.6038 type:complete len:90 (-) Transcript_4211:62-331(-)